MQPALFVFVFLLGFLGVYYKALYEAVRDRFRMYAAMRKFDGPPALPLIGSLYLVNLFNVSQLTLQVMQLGFDYCRKGAGIVQIWIGPVPMLAAVNPAYAKEILESNEVITKADEYDILFPWLGTGLLTSTGGILRMGNMKTKNSGEKWRQRRKMLTPAFHFKVLNEFLAVHDYQAKARKS